MDTIQLPPFPKEPLGLSVVGARQKYTDNQLILAAESYYQDCVKPKDGKYRMPYIQELIILLDIVPQTLYDREKTCKELMESLNKIRNAQQLRLLQKTLTKVATGAIFQLKANHGMADRIDITSKDEKVEQSPAVVINNGPIAKT